MHWEVPIHDILIATIRYIAKHCTHYVLHKAFGFLLVISQDFNTTYEYKPCWNIKRFLCHFIVNLVVQKSARPSHFGFRPLFMVLTACDILANITEPKITYWRCRHNPVKGLSRSSLLLYSPLFSSKGYLCLCSIMSVIFNSVIKISKSVIVFGYL